MLLRAAALGLWALASCATSPAPDPAIKESIDIIVAQALQTGKHQGLVIGILKDGRTEIYGYGRRSAGDPKPPDGRSVFEIGSITKTFTGILLARMADEGIVALDDPVRKFVPGKIRIPSRGDKEITLLHLATHHSGLPRMPSNFSPKNPLNPYADYTVPELYVYLTDHVLRRDPGERYEYSNLGAGLLGHVLSVKAARTYEDLVTDRICGPLGMKDTRIRLDDEQKARLVPGHWPSGQAVSNWDIPTLEGAGALRSTAEDLLRYVAANLAEADTPLGRAMKAAHEPRAVIDRKENRVGLGWHLGTLPVSRRTLVWHGGATGGYTAFAGFVPATRTAAVVLSNSSEETGLLPLLILEVLHR